ncbi:MAG: PTS sugar transporter subunit IIA [Promethearchaeota archaeon]
MLVAVFHNNQKYLESLNELAKKLGIIDTTIFEKENIGTRIVGESLSLIFHKGEILPTYDKAFIAVTKGEKETKCFIDAIENDKDLNILNAENEGFICTVPFNYIKHLELESSYIVKEEKKIRISDYLREDRILLDLKATNKTEAIQELVNLLKGSKEVINSEIFLKDIMERESLNTSGIRDQIAIPHARTDTVKSFVIVFGRSAEGIDFGALDDKPAKLIFLMGKPKKRRLKKYLTILSHLAKLLHKESFREALLKASSPKEVIDEFKKAEIQ